MNAGADELHARMREFAGERAYETWLAELGVRGVGSGWVVLDAPAGKRAWIQDRLLGVVRAAAQAVYGSDLDVRLAVGGRSSTVGKLRALDLDSIRREPPPPVDWIVEGLVSRGDATLLAGREGMGKSLLAAAFSAAIGRGGGTVAGMRCQGEGVVIVDAENGQREISRRVHALEIGSAGVTYFDVAGRNFDLLEDADELHAAVSSRAPALLVLDSLRTLWNGDEYLPREGSRVANAIAQLARACDCGVLVLHGVSRQSGEYSGNTALGHGVQHVFTLQRSREDRAQRLLRSHKARPDGEPADRSLRIERDGDRVVFVEPRGVRANPQSRDGSNGSTVEPDPSAALALTLSQIVEAVADGPLRTPDLAAAVDREPRDGTFRRALNDGVSQGVVVKVRRGLYDAVRPVEPLEPTPSGSNGSNGSGAVEPWSQAAEGGLGSNGSTGSDVAGSTVGSNASGLSLIEGGRP